MQTEVVGFIFTEKCNFRCRHCFNESQAQAPRGMQLDELLVHVTDAAACGRFVEVGISGGEPLLFPRELAALFAHARRQGLGASLTTNGFWGISERHARDVLGRLVDAGLTSINISVSAFHLEFTTPAKLRTAAGVALELGLPTRINIVETPEFGREDARALFAELADRLELVPMPCIPVGRAAAEVPFAERPPGDDVVVGTCHDFFTKVAVTSDGDVYPCCSPGGFTAPLRGGNIREERIGTIVRSMESSLLLQVLDGLGPGFFLPFVERALDRDLLAEGVVDQCHLCHRLLTEPALLAVTEAALTELESDLSALHLDFADLEALALGPRP